MNNQYEAAGGKGKQRPAPPRAPGNAGPKSKPAKK